MKLKLTLTGPDDATLQELEVEVTDQMRRRLEERKAALKEKIGTGAIYPKTEEEFEEWFPRMEADILVEEFFSVKGTLLR